MQDFHRIKHIGHYVIGTMFMARPGASIDPDCTKPSGLPPGDVGHGMVTHHPSPTGKGHTAASRGDLKQAHGGLPDTFDAREHVSIHDIG